MQPSEAALHTLRELADADLEFAMELAVSPRLALGRVRTMFGADDHHALMELASSPIHGGFPSSIPTLGPSKPFWAPPPQSLPPIHLGSSDPATTGTATINISNTSGSTRTTIFHATVPLVDKSQTPSVPVWSFEGPAPNFTLDRAWLAPENPVAVEFSTKNVPSDWPAELQLYSRDPEELAQFANLLETDYRRVWAQARTIDQTKIHDPIDPFGTSGPFPEPHVTLPDALSLLSPASWSVTASGSSTTAAVDPLTTADFFGSQPPYAGDPTLYDGWDPWNDATLNLAGQPAAHGSVKAARITYPGLCTFEHLFARNVRPDARAKLGSYPQYYQASPLFAMPGNTPIVRPGLTAAAQPAIPHIYKYFDDAFGDAFARLCAALQSLEITKVTGFPIPRNGVSSDSPAQFFLNIELFGTVGGAFAGGKGSPGDWGCRVTASALYDVKLDARGAVVFDVAQAQPPEMDNPHSEPRPQSNENKWYPPMWGYPWSWVENNGQVRTGYPSIAVNDFGGGLCHDFGAGDIDPLPFSLGIALPGLLPPGTPEARGIVGLDEWMLAFLSSYLKHRINEALRESQMFTVTAAGLVKTPQLGTLPQLATAQGIASISPHWLCNPRMTTPDPQGHLRAPRFAFQPATPLASQMEPLGFGFFPPQTQQAGQPCAAAPGVCGPARCDFCNAIRAGFARVMQLPQTAMSGCVLQGGEDLRLAAMLQSVSDRDAWNNLQHWGCRGLDPGNWACRATDPLFPCPFSTPQGCVSRQVPYCSPQPMARTFNPDPCAGCAPALNLGVCFFTPPARRLIANPDGLQVVFYDNEDDWANAALALKYALIGLNAPQNPPSGVLGSLGQLPFMPLGQPLALCNYDRFNDTEVQYVAGADVGHPVPDSYGHPVRSFSFPRPYAIYDIRSTYDIGVNKWCGRLPVNE